MKDLLLFISVEGLKANTMFRLSLIVCVFLIFGVTAKPFKPWDKLTHEAFQDIRVSIDDTGKIPWGVEVEPPEDKDKTDYNIESGMKIYQSMMDKQAAKAEEDSDHPSLADLKVQIQNEVVLLADVLREPSQKDARGRKYQEAEKDTDHISHPVLSAVEQYLPPQAAEYKAQEEVRVIYSEPEEDNDDLYHHNERLSPLLREQLRQEVRLEREVKVHLYPEEDMDHLYHRSMPYQGENKAAPPVGGTSQRKHTKPEEDLDHLYHR